MSSRVRVGALGNARILRRFISERDVNPLIEVQMIATRSAVAAEKARQSYPNKIITERYEDAVTSKDVEAIYVCLPSGLHFTWAKKALAAGKHVLIEKPAVLTEQDAQGLATLARSQQLFVMEAWWYRFHPLVEAVRALISTQALGKIRLITSNFS